MLCRVWNKQGNRCTHVQIINVLYLLFLSFWFYIRCVIVWSEAKKLIMLTEVAAEGGGGGFTHEQGLRVLVCLADT